LKNPLGVNDPDEALTVSILMLDGLVFSGVTDRAGASFFRGESDVLFQAFVGVIMEKPLPNIPDFSCTTESLLELLLAGLMGISAFLAFAGCTGASTSPSRSWLLSKIPSASSFMVVLPLSAEGLAENMDITRRVGLVVLWFPPSSCGEAGTLGGTGARLGCSKSEGIFKLVVFQVSSRRSCICGQRAS
jgi:hypothetical protein